VKTQLLEIIEKASAGAYGPESEFIGKIAGLWSVVGFNQSWGPFICGAHGDAGVDGLHEAYAICPCYGADDRCTGLYVRKPLDPNNLLT
jgi:hypothetical protein